MPRESKLLGPGGQREPSPLQPANPWTHWKQRPGCRRLELCRTRPFWRPLIGGERHAALATDHPRPPQTTANPRWHISHRSDGAAQPLFTPADRASNSTLLSNLSRSARLAFTAGPTHLRGARSWRSQLQVALRPENRSSPQTHTSVVVRTKYPMLLLLLLICCRGVDPGAPSECPKRGAKFLPCWGGD